MTKICLNCETDFDSKRPHGKFCSDTCRYEAWYAETKTLWTIKWSWRDFPEHGVNECGHLNSRVALARAISALKNSGPIVIHAIEREKERETEDAAGSTKSSK